MLNTGNISELIPVNIVKEALETIKFPFKKTEQHFWIFLQILGKHAETQFFKDGIKRI